MSLNRNVPLRTGLRYRGAGNQLAFVLHRIGGLGMAIFVTMHLLASFLGGDIGSFLNGIYENWAFQIFIFDLFPGLLEHQTEAIWVEWAVFIPVFGIAAFVIFTSALGG
jgi:succinate dehydrogenase/fumarate reductase cytochrome b subunit